MPDRHSLIARELRSHDRPIPNYLIAWLPDHLVPNYLVTSRLVPDKIIRSSLFFPKRIFWYFSRH